MSGFKITVSVLICLLFGLTGCTVSGPSYEDYKSTIPALRQDHARILFFRLPGTRLVYDQHWVSVNGTAVGPAIPGTFFHIDLRPGTYEIGSKGGKTKGYKIWKESKRKFRFSAGETWYIQATVIRKPLYGSWLQFTVRDRLQGPQFLRDLKNWGPEQ